MTRTQLARLVIPAMVAALTAGLLGCSGTSDTVASGPTALGTLSAAESALSTAVPDAKLLLVQTASSVTPTGTPVWGYLFGSPSTDKTYLVYASDGKAMGAQEYATANLSESEWAEVPDTYAWKIDSDDAYKKALEVSGANGDPAAYMMGLMTYKSSADTSTVEPLVWNVWFDPGSSGATKNTIEVDANSGDARVVE